MQTNNYFRTMINETNSIIRKIFFALIISAIIFVDASGTNSYEDWARFIDNRMQELMRDQDLPNAAVSLVAGGEIVFMRGYGFADMDAQKTADPARSMFRTGSVAKVFTWTAVMQMVERGLIDLDADVNTYLDFTLTDRIHGKNRREKAAPVTMRHLMSHTPGFEDVPEALFLLKPEDAISLREYLIRYMPARIFPAGTIMAYSNYGTALAGYIVERLSGIPFGEYVEMNIFAPLGMAGSSFSQPLPQGMMDNMVHPYRLVEGEFREGAFEIMPGPAGGMSTTAEDMARFMLANLDMEGISHNRILSPQSLRLMHTPLFTHHQLLGGMTHGFMEYSLNGQKVVFHTGSSMLFDAGIYLLPESDAGLFIVYSGGNFSGHMKIINGFINEFYPCEQSEYNINAPDAIPGMAPPATARPDVAELRGEYQQSRRIETGEDKLVNLISMVMRVEPAGERELLVSFLGTDYNFVEIEPGIYKNLEGATGYPLGPMQYLVAATDPMGRLMLVTDGPVGYIRMPYWSTSGFAALVAGISVLLALGTVLFYAGRGIRGLFRRKAGRDVSQFSPAALMARRFNILHASLVILMVVSLANAGRPDPVYLLPLTAAGHTSIFTFLLGVLPGILVLLSAFIPLFCVTGWRNRWWKLPARIFYSLYTLAALTLTWLLWFYNSAGF